eukprot:TRINITY_DN10057_c0_g1_i1.p1 TRINITY_DN10057_c0_g1~~TRINITY_DN10057_c0_g1_i1.p1  ORF type:complete len:144 (+),score=22.38 TRINITY_DN10057_c0_g1_i1:104-535(+)
MMLALRRSSLFSTSSFSKAVSRSLLLSLARYSSSTPSSSSSSPSPSPFPSSSSIPGPEGWPLIGSIPEYSRVNPVESYCVWNKWHKEHGPVIKVKIGPMVLYSVSDAHHIGQILQAANNTKAPRRPDTGGIEAFSSWETSRGY